MGPGDYQLMAFILLYVLKKVGPVELPSLDFDEWLDRETEGLEIRILKPAGQRGALISAAIDENPDDPAIRMYEDGELVEEWH